MGWFRKKKKEEPVKSQVEADDFDDDDDDDDEDEGVVTAEAESIIRRWDGMLAEMTQRFTARVAKASADSAGAQLEGGFGPLDSIWNVVEHEKHQLTDELSDAWDAISDELSEVEDLPDAVMDQEGDKRDLTHCELEIIYMRAYRNALGQAAEDLGRRAQAQVAATVQTCQSCGAQLPPPALASQAVNIQCPQCGAAAILEPGPLARQFAASGALYLGFREGQPFWEKMTRAETRINNYRESKDVPMALLEEYEAASRQYWTTVFNTEARLIPEMQPHLPEKIERYLKDAQKLLRQHWQWRERTS